MAFGCVGGAVSIAVGNDSIAPKFEDPLGRRAGQAAAVSSVEPEVGDASCTFGVIRRIVRDAVTDRGNAPPANNNAGTTDTLADDVIELVASKALATLLWVGRAIQLTI